MRVYARGALTSALAAGASLLLLLSSPLAAQAGPTSFKVAFLNIKSGKGQIALPGFPATFADTSNCTDRSQPINAWGVGEVQAELAAKVGNDPSIVALGLAEAWRCATPAAVKTALGWVGNSTERNGVALVARYGFAGPEQWTQLDTSLNTNPADTMWVLRTPVCLDALCSDSVIVFTAHWYASGPNEWAKTTAYETQAQQTIDFLNLVPGVGPQVLIGDLNVFGGTQVVCGQNPRNAPIQMLADAGYLDAWASLNGMAGGFTGMWNRKGCGTPNGNVWKRIDYSWSRNMSPLSMRRFGMVSPGNQSPSDHSGIIIEYPLPNVRPLGRARPPVRTRFGDYDGDRQADLTVYRPSTGDWVSLRSLSGMTDYTIRSWGLSSDVPVGRDYDGDGKLDPAVYRPSLGRWLVLQSSTNYTTFTSQDFGLTTDTPVPADYDGDGRTDIAVYRPSDGRWVILLSSNGTTVQYDWGVSTDVPVPGDFDGDGVSDLVVFRPSAGKWFIYNRMTGATASPDWGLSGDVPSAADFDGDGRADLAVFRPPLGRWFIKSSIDGSTTIADWGLSGDFVVPADYDGDGKVDIAVFRPSDGIWYVRGLFNRSWGLSTDIPALKHP